MIIAMMLKISFANFFIFGICFFFVWGWLVLGTNLFKDNDEISGTNKGQADLLVRNDGGVGEEEQRLINEKLNLIKKVFCQFLSNEIRNPHSEIRIPKSLLPCKNERHCIIDTIELKGFSWNQFQSSRRKFCKGQFCNIRTSCRGE